MSQAAVVRLAVLVAAVACLAIAFGLLPALKIGTDVSPAPGVIVNDTASPVVAVHCSASCPAAGGVTIAPGHELPAGLPNSMWQLRTPSGEVLGCLKAPSAAARLTISHVSACCA